MKTIQVIMLPTDKLSILRLYETEKLLITDDINNIPSNCKPQHLYLVSTNVEDEIKESDYGYDGREVFQHYKWDKEWTSKRDTIILAKFNNGEILSRDTIFCNKIIATTDSSLVINSCSNGCVNLTIGHCSELCTEILPQIPQSFIEAYAKSNGSIKFVNIEMEEHD